MLHELSLDPEEFATLRQQGFVSCERRCGRTYFRLRFRMPSGLQRTRYLGCDPGTAARVEDELAELQAARHVELELGKLTREANRRVRSIKEKLASRLEEAGYHFHGMAIRQQRGHQ